MTPAQAAAIAFPAPNPLDYGKNDEGSTLYRNACIATELRREGFIAAKKQEGWIGVEDRLPETKEMIGMYNVPRGRVYLSCEVLVYRDMPEILKDYRIMKAILTTYDDGEPHWSESAVTHWMPLPAPPVPAALTPDPNG